MTKKPTLMVLGANMYAEPAIASLKDEGYRLVIVDGNDKAPGFKHADVRGDFNFRDVVDVMNLAKNEDVKAILPTHDRAVLPAAMVSDDQNLLGTPVESAYIATGKHKMRDAWKKAGLPSPEYITVESPDELVDAVKKIGMPAIVKPTADVGGGSRGVMKIDESTNQHDAFAFAISFGDTGFNMVEPFYEGKEHSVEILMKDGVGTVLMVSDKIQTKPPYRVGKSLIYPSVVGNNLTNKIKKLAIDSALAVGLVNGAAHVELVSMNDGRLELFEIGLRCGGGVIPHPIATAVTGINQFIEYAKILTGESDGNFNPVIQQSACWHFITSEPGTVKKIAGFEEASNMEGIIDSGLNIKPGDTIEPLRTAVQRLGYFVSVGKTNEEAYARAISAEKNLKIIC